FRFVQRLYRLARGVAAEPAGMSAGAEPDAARALRQVTHRTIEAVTGAIEDFAFNVAVARLYELANAAGEAEGKPELIAARREAVATLIRLAAPIIPHVAEEAYALLASGEGLVADLPWPEADADLVRRDRVTLAVQVMGKLRGTIELPVGADADTAIAAALADQKIARVLEGATIVKRVHVPDRIVNFVVRP
ncbi:MAG TPA: class I tRNA ligase family protein, partial [Acidiphilium sp.]